MAVSDQPQFLLFGAGRDDLAQVADSLRMNGVFRTTGSLEEAVQILGSGEVGGLCLLSDATTPTELLLEMGGLLRVLPDGLLILDVRGEVLWVSERAARILDHPDNLVGNALFDALGPTVIMGPEYSPINRVLLDVEPVRTLLKTDDATYLELTISPVVPKGSRNPQWLLASIRDSTQETILHQRQNAIIQAGLELSDLQPQDIVDLSQDERVDLLKSRLLHYTQDILEFDNVEIRLIDPGTTVLLPLVSMGVSPAAASRHLEAKVSGNGVTGYVAATGRSYLCPDTQEDELYLTGVEGARSSLTVPLLLHEEVLGTFNVESARPRAFTNADLQYLELFCREVAIALNTLNLLNVEKASAVLEGTRQMLCEVAAPVDAVLNDAVALLSRFQVTDEESAHKLRNILRHTRLVRDKIREVGDKLSANCKVDGSSDPHPLLRSKRILVVDVDDSILGDANRVLSPYGCIVETAHNGEEALMMASMLHYDVLLADIQLPDLRGFKMYSTVREAHEHLPIILMTGFGYDGGHTLVKARSAGMKTAVFKPFKPHMLIKAIEECLQPAVT
ncbi:MAG: response regulator [Planctomycetaceae bacterium]|nr:response regulator [Planctomycetaceae bacterium]